MVAEIIEFPTDDPPRPFKPAAAVRAYLNEEKADAVISFRIPEEVKASLQAESFESNSQFSKHVASIVCEHLLNQGLHCIRVAGLNRARAQAEKAA